jgi:hypothetical protein
MTARLVGNEAQAEASRRMHVLGRLGTGDDVAAAVAFLLDPTNDWITGQVLGVDGGLGQVRTRLIGLRGAAAPRRPAPRRSADGVHRATRRPAARKRGRSPAAWARLSREKP